MQETPLHLLLLLLLLPLSLSPPLLLLWMLTVFCIALLVNKSVQQLFCVSYRQTTKFYVGDCCRCYSGKKLLR